MKNIIIFSFFAIAAICFFACAKDKGDVSGLFSDKKLFELAQNSTGHTYYQNGAALPAAGNSPHGSFRLRFNPKAFSALDSLGELPAGNVFPDSSLLVKEALSGNNVNLYAVMYKKQGAWLWAEYKPDGETVYSLFKDPSGCTSCHSQTPNRDFVRTFDLH